MDENSAGADKFTSTVSPVRSPRSDLSLDLVPCLFDHCCSVPFARSHSPLLLLLLYRYKQNRLQFRCPHRPSIATLVPAQPALDLRSPSTRSPHWFLYCQFCCIILVFLRQYSKSLFIRITVRNRQDDPQWDSPFPHFREHFLLKSTLW
jgi:hypothetical protein